KSPYRQGNTIRAERCPKLLNHLKHQDASKKFVVDTKIDRQNSRGIAFEPSAVPLSSRRKIRPGDGLCA
ncbi:Hypothetical protein FKW44_003808, partial [Caligus rogercresseyi]